MSRQKTFSNLLSCVSHAAFWLLNYYVLPHAGNAYKIIDKNIAALPGVTKARHLYGSVEWRYKNKPIGHIHGNRIVDISSPTKIQSEILREGMAVLHKYSRNGISVYLLKQQHVNYAIDLLLRSYYLIKPKIDKNE